MTPPDAIDAAGEPLGTGWRVAAWMAFALSALIAFIVMTTKAENIVEGALVVLAAFSVMVAAAVGIMFGIFGAVASSSAGDRRFVVILPVFANAGLLLWFVVMTFRPR